MGYGFQVVVCDVLAGSALYYYVYFGFAVEVL